MADKQKFSPTDTYVLDDDDLEELEDTSLTGVVRELAGAMRELVSNPEHKIPDSGQPPEDLELDFGILDKRNDSSD